MENYERVLIYGWLMFITLLLIWTSIYVYSLDVDNINSDNKYDELFDRIETLRVRTNKLHRQFNETSFLEYFDRCHKGFHWIDKCY